MEEEVKKQGAQAGNMNARKNDDEPLNSKLMCWCGSKEKAEWVRKAQEANMKFSEWVRKKLNE